MIIANRKIGAGHPAYIIAEMSANHHQSFDQAVAIVHAAQEAGADAVKLQTYTADTMTLAADSGPFRIGAGTIWEGRNLYDLYAEACTPWDWQPRLKAVADELGIALFSSPFDDTAVDFLETMRVPAYKIASFELVDLPLIRRVAQTGKPIIISTGMATIEEIDEAVEAARSGSSTEIALLKCTSAYPSPPSAMNLNTIRDLSSRYGLPIGLSDHTMGAIAPVVAVSLGACIIEKHFTLDRNVTGPDSAFSMEPAEFKEMVQAVRTAEESLGTVSYGRTGAEEASAAFRRSLFVVGDVAEGEAFTPENVRAIRPGNGLAPKYLEQVLGSTASRAIPRGTPLSWDLIAGARRDTP